MFHRTIEYFRSKPFLGYSMNALYKVIGVSKQAVHQHAKQQQEFTLKLTELILLADHIRDEHPGCGVEKMYYMLAPDFIGRDRFIDIFMELGYRLKKVKNYRKTTISSHIYKYDNLIQGMVINKPSAIWQTDITYFEVEGKFYYGVFIKDVYTKEITGYHVADNMRVEINLKALDMALKEYSAPDIHHSDRGSQYTSIVYTEMLKAHGCLISMGLIAQDNAYAERLNRTIKEEYIIPKKPRTFQELKRLIKKAVENYNTKRIHNAFRPLKMSPKEYHDYVLTLKQEERPKVTLYAEVNKTEGAFSPHCFEEELPSGSFDTE